jgi:hypothetical protein
MTAILVPIPNQPKCTSCHSGVENNNKNTIKVHGIEIIDENGKSKRISGDMIFCNIYCLNTYIMLLGNGDE